MTVSLLASSTALAGFIGFWLLGAVLTIRTTRSLIELERRDPTVFSTAGLTAVDWMPRFYLGLFRLAFGESGRSLPTSERALYRGTAAFVLAATAFGVAAVALY